MRSRRRKRTSLAIANGNSARLRASQLRTSTSLETIRSRSQGAIGLSVAKYIRERPGSCHRASAGKRPLVSSSWAKCSTRYSPRRLAIRPPQAAAIAPLEVSAQHHAVELVENHAVGGDPLEEVHEAERDG